jgi:UDP-N-acetylglucosamine 2-epimerase (non-hydrolysing)
LKILFIFGTRPEAIKLVTLIKTLHNDPFFEVKVCVTGQHKEMLNQILSYFNIKIDYSLDIMKPNQSLFDITSSILLKLKPIIEETNPNYVIVHGDTTTSFAASLSAYYLQVKVVHVEAGLRTNNIYSPWPEEINRRLTSMIANLHLAPTLLAKENLLKEGKTENQIYVTGNTVIDTLLYTKNIIETNPEISNNLNTYFNFLNFSKKIVLITCHRRESFGQGFLNICQAILELSKKYSDIQFVYPVHLNPNVSNIVYDKLANITNIFLINPVDYVEFIYLMKNSFIILTDSGGIQEEAPSFGIPVLVLRETTERQEAINAGTVKLVGTDANNIINNFNLLIDSKLIYNSFSKISNPYGDGKASILISNILKSHV